MLRNRNARAAWFDEAAAVIGEPGLAPHEYADLDDVADRLDALRTATRNRAADNLRTAPHQRQGAGDARSEGSQARRLIEGVETRGIGPLTPALQRRCSAN